MFLFPLEAQYLNMLQSNKEPTVVFLSDVLQAIGLPISLESHLYGWTKETLKDPQRSSFNLFFISDMDPYPGFEIIFDCDLVIGDLPKEKDIDR